MCGIAAAAGPVGRVGDVVRALRHRGPDQSGWITWESFAVGAARLRITGDSRADQPLDVGPILLAANGEVFNHAGLREVHEDRGEGDLPPLARLLAADFPRAVERVRGHFALAAVHRHARMLVLARDENGVRPLHVASTGAGPVASSEIWPLLDCLGPGVPAPDYGALAHLLAFQFLPPGRTLFRDVASVRPGEIRLYDESGALARREAFRYAAGGASDADLAAALREAAALQGPRSRRAAVFLSGGIDSSAVAALLCEAGHAPDLAITGWFPEGDASLDERPHARAVAAELGIPVLEVPIRAADALEVFPALVRALGGPLAGPGGMAQLLLARAAAEDGVRIVFSGEGGDEVFGGYERHRLLQLIETGAAVEPSPGYRPLARLMEAAQDPLAAAVFRGGELLALMDVEARLDVARAAFEALPAPGPGRTDQALALERERFLPGLLAVDDATLSAFGIEGRAPLLDPVVARAASAVPLALKSPPFAPRRLFKQALGRALPRALASRRDKMGFPMPLDVWLSTPPWREFALDRIRPASLGRFGFDGRKVRDAFENGRLSARARWFLLSLDVFDELLSGRAASE